MNSLQRVILNYFMGMGKTEAITVQVNVISMFEKKGMI